MTTAQATTPKTPALKRTKLGTVLSDRRDKTRTVAVDFQNQHSKYGKYIKRTQKYHVHDALNQSKRGDRVEIAPCRPLSKTKSWRLVRVVESAPEGPRAQETMAG